MCSQTCGTCKFYGFKGNRFKEKRGYCYFNPPHLGGLRPQLHATERACGQYQSYEDDTEVNETVSRK